MVLARTFLVCLLWGLVLQFMAGYFFLHSWSNLFGELLRFADREFYSVSHSRHVVKLVQATLAPLAFLSLPLSQDWWTCTSYSSFYRKWNLLVHDWIKAYIYQDLKDVSQGWQVYYPPSLELSLPFSCSTTRSTIALLPFPLFSSLPSTTSMCSGPQHGSCCLFSWSTLEHSEVSHLILNS